MAAFPNNPVGRYCNVDPCAMVVYAQNAASTSTPVRRIEEPASNVGKWRGTRPTIFLIAMYREEGGVVYEQKFSGLLALANRSDDISIDTLFMVYVNIIRFTCPGKDEEIRGIFRAKGYNIMELDEVGTKAWFNTLHLRIRQYTQEQLDGLTEEQRDALVDAQNGNDQALAADSPLVADDKTEIPLKVLCWVIGVYFNLITKKLTALNLDHWYKGRIRAYSRGTHNDVDEAQYLYVRPSVKFAEAVSLGVAGCFHFKRTVFFTVRELASIVGHPLSEVATITMGYFRMAELTSFGMVVEYILTQNPVLLSWNGVAKYMVHFKSALDKFRSLGAKAPYCKLLYPPEDLKEFKGERIGILTNIAHDIVTMEGRSTLTNLKGVSTFPLPTRILDTVRRIITLYSGAITPSVAHSRQGTFAHLDVDSELANILNSKATEDNKDQEEEPTPAFIQGVYTRERVVINCTQSFWYLSILHASDNSFYNRSSNIGWIGVVKYNQTAQPFISIRELL